MHIRIYQDGSHHLFTDLNANGAIPFSEILKDCAGDYTKEYPLYRQFDGSKWEKVGTVDVRGLLMMPQWYNSIFQSLQKLRGKEYTWSLFCEARKKKIKQA